jgi:hypothetical protein
MALWHVCGTPDRPPATTIFDRPRLGILTRDFVSARARFERATYCLGGTLRRSPGVALRSLIRRLPASIVAARRLVSPGPCPCWLPVRLPGFVSMANYQAALRPRRRAQLTGPVKSVRCARAACDRQDPDHEVAQVERQFVDLAEQTPAKLPLR